MRAHWLNDGEEVLVTGTLDPDRARKFLEDDGEVDMLEYVEGMEGYPSRGNVVPASPGNGDGYTWFWVTSENGRCKGVTFG